MPAEEEECAASLQPARMAFPKPKKRGQRASGSGDRTRPNRDISISRARLWFLLLYCENATHIPATDTATAQKSPGRYNANVVGGFDFSQPLQREASPCDSRALHSSADLLAPPLSPGFILDSGGE
ncbi:hypothetical protein WMY93_001324 [Mugilogobius chulae]|uniref:Uncharacterized protein n=1 Tax=Mugilogobius chulae TaxID=88201 RepID=A0AAW0Q3E8_9GOBI